MENDENKSNREREGERLSIFIFPFRPSFSFVMDIDNKDFAFKSDSLSLLASYVSWMGCNRTKEREREKDALRGTRTTHLLLSGQMSLAS